MSDSPGSEAIQDRTVRRAPSDHPDRPLAALTELCEAQTQVIRVLRDSLNQAHELLADLDRERVVFAHDVGMPLNAVLGRLEALTVSDLPDEVTAAIQQATTEIDRLVRLVGVHALEPSGHIRPATVDARALEVAAVFREVIVEAGAALGGRHVEVRVEPGLRLHTSAAMVRRLLLNLVLNAAEHTPAGTPIELVGERAGAGIALRVCDRGPGLPPEINLARLEIRPDGTAGPYGGLGLLTVRTIAESLGGLAGLVLRLGGGTEATFWLPNVPAAPMPGPERP